MKLYRAQHTCAIGIHVVLEEIGAPYTTEELPVAALSEPAFRRINPKGKVPTVERDDGSVLTEYGAIATWLARQHPEAGLLPEDPEAEARMREAMDYAVGTLHAQGFGRIFMPAKFEPPDLVHKAGLGASSVKALGREMVEQGFAILDAGLAGREWVAGDRYSIGDSALFYCERWAPQVGIELPANLAAHFERMKARPAVRRVLEVWGEAP
ncbi:glutathione S-transferase family protein [Roseomonas elaeocarpi]|uniref:Glutathione S-transferase family protein n=1 Tax=Roseomonas elaeocarpi TaxID=907779 RepID=A0ABV6JUK7_9PROT